MRNMAASGDISRVEAAIFLGLTTYLHSSGINTSETIVSPPLIPYICQFWIHNRTI